MIGGKVAWVALAATGVLLACSGDDDTKPADCPPGTAVNALLQCTCDDGPNGLTQCQADNTLTGCDCSEEAQNFAATMTPAGTPMTNMPADNGAVNMPGDSQTPGGDSQTPPTDTSPPTNTPPPGNTTPPPSTGDGDGDEPGLECDPDEDAGTSCGLLTRCDGDEDCDPGLACYTFGSGDGHCTETCNDDTDCADIPDFTYTCYVDGNLCRIECTPGEADNCPEGQSCQLVANMFNRCVY